ncbi:Orc1-type DNA replication protein [Haloferax volcanii JCM 10717]|uniref:ORC1-type DNA replication protein n=2 Tax=Haloferacaceae TaxID=1644056 RepID=M0HVZ8_HALVO|nr:Orc1-type DNA replication protein [Haloferax alexandrinus JCM 10717]
MKQMNRWIYVVYRSATRMGSFEFSQSNQIFKNRDVLREDYTPEELVGRDEELSEYHSALQPVINNELPSNIFLYGKSGVGKTAATRFLLDRLQDAARSIHDLDLHAVRINCDGLNTSYQVAVTIINRLRSPENQIPMTGYPQSKVYQFLWEELDQYGTILIILDEVDHVNDDSLLYQIPRARDNGYVTSAKIGLIGISNDLSYREGLSAKVQSSLCEKEVYFPPYDAGELRKVLEQRTQVAFRDDALSEDVIPLCAAYGAKDSGDARQAINLLLEAGDIARNENAPQVTKPHVDQAKRKLESDQITTGVSKLTEHARLTLYALTTFAADGETPVTSPTIRERYLALCSSSGIDPLSHRQMQSHLSELKMMGVITGKERNLGRRGGKKVLYGLNYDLGLITETLADTIDEIGVHRSIQSFAKNCSEQ